MAEKKKEEDPLEKRIKEGLENYAKFLDSDNTDAVQAEIYEGTNKMYGVLSEHIYGKLKKDGEDKKAVLRKKLTADHTDLLKDAWVKTALAYIEHVDPKHAKAIKNRFKKKGEKGKEKDDVDHNM